MSVWLLSLLVAFNLVSSIAQFRNIREKRYKTNSSFIYLSFNIFSATEQAKLGLSYAGHVVKKSRSPGDALDLRSQEWMNLSQIATVWMVFVFAQFLISVTFGSISSRWKISLIVVNVLHVFDFIRPILGDSSTELVGTSMKPIPLLLFYINPALIYLAIHASSKRGPTKPNSASLWSIAGIASQAAVHGVLLMSWALMIWPGFARNLTRLAANPLPALVMSWNRFCWPLVDNGIFLVLQGRLLWSGIRGRKVDSGEGQRKVQAVDEVEDEDEDEDGEVTLPLTV